MLFFGQESTAKMKKIYLLNEKNGIRSIQRHEVPKIRDFTNNYWMGRSCTTILYVSIAVLFRALSKYFSDKDGSALP